jgi:hypothetical protein
MFLKCHLVRVLNLAALAILTAPLLSYSKEVPKEDFAGKDKMSEIHFSDFKDFEKKFKFVTVRFRKDTGEMRFTFANEKAWNTLNQNGVDYPDGSVFAKIGIASKDDASFPASAVPDGARRYQFMVRDRGKFKDTDGWGYALFDAGGVTFPEDPKITVNACAACHRIVPERGFVFSQQMGLSGISNPEIGTPSTKFTFSDMTLAALPKAIGKLLPKGTSRIRRMEGELRKNIFQGTLDEIRPILAAEALRSHNPAILLSDDEKRYSLVIFDPTGTCVGNGEKRLKSISTLNVKDGAQYTISFCQPLREKHEAVTN